MNRLEKNNSAQFNAAHSDEYPEKKPIPQRGDYALGQVPNDGSEQLEHEHGVIVGENQEKGTFDVVRPTAGKDTNYIRGTILKDQAEIINPSEDIINQVKAMQDQLKNQK